MGNATLAQLSQNFVYSAVAVYALAMVAYAAEVAFGGSRGGVTAGRVGSGASYAVGGGRVTTLRVPGGAGRHQPPGGRADRVGRVALSLTVLAFGLHLAGVLARAGSAGRVPWGNMYEFSLTAALAVAGVYLVLLRRYPIRFLGVVVVPVVLLTLGLATTVLYIESAELVPALKSPWLAVHVAAAVLSAGLFTVGAALTVVYLLRERAERRGPLRGWIGRLPSAQRVDALAARLHAFAFPLWTFAVVAGAIWAENAWGRYWGWDPKETWAFVTWIVYAGYLHARATAGWRGRAAAAVALTGYGCFLFNYFGVNLLFSGFHSYAF
jgi:cytochrome c-type biogenesis protein CcsB